MQQLKIIEHFVNKNHSKTKVIGCKTIRDKNGVALSSRNFLLSIKENQIASKIYKLIYDNKQNLIKKKLSLVSVKRKIFMLGARKIDYVTMLDINKLTKPYKRNNKYKIFVAYYLGSTRLIDNI